MSESAPTPAPHFDPAELGAKLLGLIGGPFMRTIIQHGLEFERQKMIALGAKFGVSEADVNAAFVAEAAAIANPPAPPAPPSN